MAKKTRTKRVDGVDEVAGVESGLVRCVNYAACERSTGCLHGKPHEHEEACDSAEVCYDRKPLELPERAWCELVEEQGPASPPATPGKRKNHKERKERKEPAGARFEMVGVAGLRACGYNRRYFPEPDEENEYLVELSESIRRLGVLEPILVRGGGGEVVDGTVREGQSLTGLEVVAGECRWRAARLAGLQEIPAMVREMTDDEALEVCVTENLHRRDLHPLEEAQSLGLLMERGWTLEGAAEHVGKSASWVARRSVLRRLTDSWVEAIHAAGSVVGQWSAGHWMLIARMPAVVQEEALRVWGDERAHAAMPSLAGLRSWCAQRMRVLRLAPWELGDEDLVVDAGSCQHCRRVSGTQPELWDGEDFALVASALTAPEYDGREEGVCVVCGENENDEYDVEWANEGATLCEGCWGKMARERALSAGGLCLDAACWRRKMRAWLEAQAETMRAEFGSVRLVGPNYVSPELEYGVEAECRPWDVVEVDAGTPGAVATLVVSGVEAGTVGWTLTNKEARAAAAKEADEADEGETDEALAAEDAEGALRERVSSALRAMADDGTAGIDVDDSTRAAVLRVFAVGVDCTCKNVWDAIESAEVEMADEEDNLNEALRCAMRMLALRAGHAWQASLEEVRATAETFGIACDR